MITLDYARLMARYNRWMNENLYAASAKLTDAQRKEDRGAFFKSLHGTLEHLMWADLAWMYRFTGRSIDGLDPKSPRFADFETMQRERIALDGEIDRWVETITPEWLASEFRYFSKAYDRHFEWPAWICLTHFFNHETHHRGQVTTLLKQYGVDPGVTDLPMMPGLRPDGWA